MNFFLTLFLILLMSSAVYADSSKTYEAKIPVSSQSEASKREAIQKALSEILFKNSPNPKVLSNTEIKEILSNAHDYIESYQYFNQKKRGGLQKFIQVNFNKEDIDRILRKVKTLSLSPTKASAAKTSPDSSLTDQKTTQKNETASPTPHEKPTIVWLAVKTISQKKPELIEYEQGQPIEKLLALIAQKKNIPILIPEIDVDNISLATGENIWKLEKSLIQELSSRYENSNSLAGRLEENRDGQWQGTWIFGKKNAWSELETTGETPESNLNQILNTIETSSTPTDATAPEKENPETFLIEVHQINNLEENNKLLEYLAQLPGINQVDTISIQSDHVVLEVQAKGGKETFEKAIASSSKLLPTTVIELDSAQDANSPNKKIDLQYDWQEPLLSAPAEH